MANVSVEIYSTPTCPDCKAAKAFLSQHNISFTEHNVGDQPDEADELKKLTGKTIVPTLIIGDKTYIGFAANRKKIEELVLGFTS